MRTLVVQYWFRQPAFWGLTWGKWSDIQTIFVDLPVFMNDNPPMWRIDLEIQAQELIQEKLRSQGIEISQILIESVTLIV